MAPVAVFQKLWQRLRQILRKQERLLLLSFTHIAEEHYLNISTETVLVVIIIMIKQLFHRTTEVSVKKNKFHVYIFAC